MRMKAEDKGGGYKRILVTGGSGVIGTAIRSIDSEYEGREFRYIASRDCNLTRLDETLALVNEYKPDAILHTAALAGGVQLSRAYPATLLRDNLLMNVNILEAARLGGVGKTVMSLSNGMYPENAPLPLCEESIHDGVPHESNYSYSFAKRLVEPSIKAYHHEYGLNVIGLVPNGIYGENANFKYDEAGMVSSLIRRFYENRLSDAPIVIWGDGSPLREYTYSKDLARAYMWCLDNYDQQQILNVGSTEEHSVKEIAMIIAGQLGISEDRLFFDTSKPAGIPRRSTDNSKFVGISGFRYTSIRDGLKHTITWLSQNYGIPGNVRL